MASSDASGKARRDSLQQRHSLVKFSRWLPVGIMLVGMIAGACLYGWLDRTQAAYDGARVSASVSRTEAWLAQTLEGYGDALRASAAYLSASGRVNPLTWRSYVRRTQTLDHYPAETSFFVDDADVAAFEQRYQATIDPRFKVHRPPGGNDEPQSQHFVLVAIEPLGSNSFVLGTDQASEPRRRATILAARDQGRPVMTPPVVLHRGSGTVLGLVLMESVYKDGAKVDTVEQRRAAFQGSVGTTFTVPEFFGHAAAISGGDVTMTVFHGSVAPENLVYGPNSSSKQPHFEIDRTLTLAGNAWTIG